MENIEDVLAAGYGSKENETIEDSASSFVRLGVQLLPRRS